jgi:hypothetical protein
MKKDIMECFHFNSIGMSTYLECIFCLGTAAILKWNKAEPKETQKNKDKEIIINLPRENFEPKKMTNSQS